MHFSGPDFSNQLPAFANTFRIEGMEKTLKYQEFITSELKVVSVADVKTKNYKIP